MKRRSKVLVVPAGLLLIMFSVNTLIAAQEGTGKPSKAEVMQRTKKLQMPFIANEGQADERVLFYANTFGGTVFVTKDGEIVYAFPGRDEGHETRVSGQESRLGEMDYGPWIKGSGIRSKSEILDLFLISYHEPASRIVYSSPNPIIPQSEFQNPKFVIKAVALKEELVGGKMNEIKGEAKAITKVNYFKGKDSSQWKTSISTYDVVTLGEVYEGIELKLKACGNNVEKLFHVKPDTNPDQIKVKLSGAKALKVNEEGQLEAETDFGTVKFTRPIACQEICGNRVEVAVEYNIQGSEARNQNTNTNLNNPKSEVQNQKMEYGFKVASYDKTRELVIDPLLASTYLGGSSSELGYSIATDPVGNVYVAGQTLSTDFPTTTGAYDASYNGGNGDAFVSRLNGDLTSLLSSTYLGGSGTDFSYAIAIAIDSDGNVYLSGTTDSSEFPITTGAYDVSYNGGDGDAFVSKLNGDLTSLLSSTYLGGDQDDNGESMVIDSSENIFVVGRTFSVNFPTTSGAYDVSYNGGREVFVSKFNGDLTSLLASTYLGGDQDDLGGRIAIKTDGNLYVTGATSSVDFPTTTGAYNTLHNGGRDAFVSKLSNDLTSILTSTYLGGSGNDDGGPIIIDADENVYVSVQTDSANFPTTAGAYDTSHNGSIDSTVSKLDGDLTSLLASTYLGGTIVDVVYSMAMNSSRNIYVTGWTNSTDFPTTMEAYDISFNGYPWDAFLSKLNGDLTILFASTYLGGSADDLGYSIAINSNENIYVSGAVKSTDFPITPSAYDTSFNDISDNYDVFISKFDSNLSAQITSTPTPTPSPVVTPTPKPEVIPAAVDIKPETINLKSKSSFKAFIKLLSPYDVNKIVTDTIECEGAEAIDGKVDKDRFIATFKRQDLDLDSDSDEELTVTGELEDGTKFEGSDIVKIIKVN
ncbi:MAG: hypothetical protein E3K36_01510 [Candidatus Brocadia sp.]|nr:hypothetical protein [Candidatus Brocadia sp.]